MLKISHAAFPGLSLVISAKFAPEMCLAARNRQKFIKLILAFKVIRGHWFRCQSKVSVRLSISD